MLDEKDIEFLAELVKDKIKEHKGMIAGKKHFLECKIRMGEQDLLLVADKKEIQELEEKIEYSNDLLEKLKGML